MLPWGLFDGKDLFVGKQLEGEGLIEGEDLIESLQYNFCLFDIFMNYDSYDEQHSRENSQFLFQYLIDIFIRSTNPLNRQIH